MNPAGIWADHSWWLSDLQRVTLPAPIRKRLESAVKRATNHQRAVEICPIFIEDIEIAVSLFIECRGRFRRGLQGTMPRHRGEHDSPLKSDIMGPLDLIDKALGEIDAALKQLPTDQAFEIDALVRLQAIPLDVRSRHRAEYLERLEHTTEGHAIEMYFPETQERPGIQAIIGRLHLASELVRDRANTRSYTESKTAEKKGLVFDIAKVYKAHIGEPSTNGEYYNTPFQLVMRAAFDYLEQAGHVDRGVSDRTLKRYAEEKIRLISVMSGPFRDQK